MPDVGASAVLGGDTSKGGYGASEAYVPGKVSHRSHNVQFEQATQAVLTNEVPVTDGPNVIQKVKSKRYRGDAAVSRRVVFILNMCFKIVDNL